MAATRRLVMRKPAWTTCAGVIILASCACIHLAAQSASSAGEKNANTLQRITALGLPQIPGAVPVFYSSGAKPQALRYQKSLTDCIAWYESHLHVQTQVTLAVLNQADWDRVGRLVPYPMPQASRPHDGVVVVLPDSFKTFPGADAVSNPDELLDFISFHETGHLFQDALDLYSPDKFLQEFYATALASSYAVARRPELLTAAVKTNIVNPRYTSLEDMDLIYTDMGFANYGWMQTQISRSAIYFVKDQDVAALVERLKGSFKDGQILTTSEVIDKLEAIRPGYRAYVGSLAKPTTLPLISLSDCVTSPSKGADGSTIGILNLSGHAVNVTEDGAQYPLRAGYSTVGSRIGNQFRLPSGKCVTYPATPGYFRLP
jgi:hypothetical protein